jgi:glutaredoxin/glutathione-dependent peroxiredoxin
MIEAGQAIPSVPVKLVTGEGISDTTSGEVFGVGRVVMFAVPGAFTPTCHVNHLPGFLANTGKLHAAGVDRIVCASVNDHHVMKAWAEASGALGEIDFLADGNAALAVALGLAKDTADMGRRFRRSAMIVENGLVQAAFIEDAPGVNASGAPAILMALEAARV